MRRAIVAQFQHVGKTYDGRTRAVRNVTFDVRQGELLALLGPTGSGKTTCLSMLAGFEAPTAGLILLGGRPAENIPSRRREMGVVSQDGDLFPHLTVRENLAFPLQARSLSKASLGPRLERALGLVGLAGLGDRRPSELTAGELRRAAIARALVFEPRIVLLDEPLGALDRRMRERMLHEIRRVQRTLGVTMVYATHDQEEAIAVADRVAVFNDGGIEQIDAPEVLYEEPRSVFVARYLGDNNVVAGRVVGKTGDYAEVAVEDGVLGAFLVQDASVGDSVVLAIRPERVGLEPPAGRFTNEFVVAVEDIVYLGDRLLIRTTVCGNPDFVVKIPNVVGHGAVLPGDQVRIGWTTIDCRALAADGQRDEP